MLSLKVFERFLDGCCRDRRRHSKLFNWANVKWFCVSDGVFSACFHAVLGIKCACITSNFARTPDDVRIRDIHSEAERASPRTKSIILHAYHSSVPLCQVLGENIGLVVSCVRHRADFSPTEPYNGDPYRRCTVTIARENF